MVRFFVCLSLCLCNGLFSGEFTASVNRNQISVGESLVLKLKLTDASPKSSPSLSPLQSAFVIKSQNQSSSTVIANGRVSSSITWQYTLVPTQEGEQSLPSLSIVTSDGVLETTAIPIWVTSKLDSAVKKESVADNGLTLTTKVSNKTPFHNEPFTYTITLISKKNLVNVSAEKLVVNDAVVEMIGEPKITQQIVDGVRANVLDISFIITPMKAGALTIPSTFIQGSVPTRGRSRSNTVFDEDFDPFPMMFGFERSEPFALATGDTVVDVRPPVETVRPWLPVESLQLKDEWLPPESIKVGEPISWVLTIEALGIKGSQLPPLNDQLKNSQIFKVYADKPEITDSIDNGKLKTFKKETFTVIPQRSGVLKLPEIKLSWWNVKANRPEKAVIAAREINVLPADVAATAMILPTAELQNNRGDSVEPSPSNLLLYGVITCLASLLLVAFFWVFALQRRIYRLAEPVVKAKLECQPEKKMLPASLKQLQFVKTPAELQQFLQGYGYANLDLAPNATTKSIGDALCLRAPENHREEISALVKSLDDALYHDKSFPLQENVNRYVTILQNIKEKKVVKRKSSNLQDLNPR